MNIWNLLQDMEITCLFSPYMKLRLIRSNQKGFSDGQDLMGYLWNAFVVNIGRSGQNVIQWYTSSIDYVIYIFLKYLRSYIRYIYKLGWTLDM